MSNDVIVIIGAGRSGEAIAQRQGAGKSALLAGVSAEALAAKAAAPTQASYRVETLPVDLS